MIHTYLGTRHDLPIVDPAAAILLQPLTTIASALWNSPRFMIASIRRHKIRTPNFKFTLCHNNTLQLAVSFDTLWHSAVLKFVLTY